jgi:hypothetical protein
MRLGRKVTIAKRLGHPTSAQLLRAHIGNSSHELILIVYVPSVDPSHENEKFRVMLEHLVQDIRAPKLVLLNTMDFKPPKVRVLFASRNLSRVNLLLTRDAKLLLNMGFDPVGQTPQKSERALVIDVCVEILNIRGDTNPLRKKRNLPLITKFSLWGDKRDVVDC